jgi:hypothetical protein
MQTDPAYFLESIEVVAGNCTDNILIGDVDLFYTISTPSSVVQQVTSGNYITQPFPLFINLANPLQLTGQSVSIAVYDNDDLFWTTTEDCGSFSFTPMQQAGTFSANGGGLSINYTVMEVPANTVTSTDTIYVYDYPLVPNLVYDTLNNLIYTSVDSIAMQWYGSNGVINGANQSFFPATVSGLYYVVATDEFGCTYSSDTVSLGHSTSLASIPFSGIVKVGPNPVSNGYPLTVRIQNAEFSDVTIVLMDVSSREVIRRVVNPSLFPYRFNSQEISELPNGLYFLDISFDGNKIRKKIIKTGTN